MSFKKIANAAVREPLTSVHNWELMYGDNTFGRRTAAFNRVADDASEYLLSHCTIMSSVMCEEDPYDYWIKPACSHLVNNNDDAWSNEVLKLSHRSFVGAFNFVEHFQNSQHAKGHILDAVLRRVKIMPPEVWVYFCDILVATDLSHEKLVNDIRNEKVKYLSMGCVTDLVICSYCGAHVTDQDTYCRHLKYQKGTFLTDEEGTPRRVAELCGHRSLPNGGVKFVEASWVATPAFPGAAKRNIVSEGWEGPKSPYTHASKKQSGLGKTASASSNFETLNLDEALLNASLRRRFS